jgi:hypothetical protein
VRVADLRSDQPREGTAPEVIANVPVKGHDVHSCAFAAVP